ncbi:MAG: hypothetical protein CMO26_11200 [Thiotrichales bacterium]|nr:hypothetical protein [Thiotrichales bacterium]
MLVDGRLYELQRLGSWRSIHDVKPRTVIIYLHGCDGHDLDTNAVLWRRLARLGYLTVMPDSFARPGRLSVCGHQKAPDYAATRSEL